MITQNQPVPQVPYIQSGTVKQSIKNGTHFETNDGTTKNTIDIKALAIRVLEKSRQGKNGTHCETHCETEAKISETPIKQRYNIEDILYEFEERVAIMMFDGGLSETKATNKTFLEISKNFFFNTL